MEIRLCIRIGGDRHLKFDLKGAHFGDAYRNIGAPLSAARSLLFSVGQGSGISYHLDLDIP